MCPKIYGRYAYCSDLVVDTLCWAVWQLTTHQAATYDQWSAFRNLISTIYPSEYFAGHWYARLS